MRSDSERASPSNSSAFHTPSDSDTTDRDDSAAEWHHHHHPRISSRRKSWNKTSRPLCVTYYTTAVMSMLLWPIVCVAVWSAEQLRLQCTLECPQRRQRRDRRRQRIPNLCRNNNDIIIILLLIVYSGKCLRCSYHNKVTARVRLIHMIKNST